MLRLGWLVLAKRRFEHFNHLFVLLYVGLLQLNSHMLFQLDLIENLINLFVVKVRIRIFEHVYFG